MRTVQTPYFSAIPLLAGLLFLTAAFSTYASDTMRCGNQIVRDGDLAARVTGLCGEPAYRDERRFRHRFNGEWVSDSETWYYNFGPSNLLRVVEIQNGRVKTINSDGYGYKQSDTSDFADGQTCAPSSITTGMSKFRLLRTCGEPVQTDSVRVYVPLSDRQRSGGWSFERYPAYPNGPVEEVVRETWIYNFGSRYLIRHVTLENGMVVSVESGDRGF